MRKHNCGELDFAKGLNSDRWLINLLCSGDGDWQMSIETSDSDLQDDYIFTAIEGFKCCPFCGKKLL